MDWSAPIVDGCIIGSVAGLSMGVCVVGGGSKALHRNRCRLLVLVLLSCSLAGPIGKAETAERANRLSASLDSLGCFLCLLVCMKVERIADG